MKRKPTPRKAPNVNDTPVELFNGDLFALEQALNKPLTSPESIAHFKRYFNRPWVGDLFADMAAAQQKIKVGCPELLKQYLDQRSKVDCITPATQPVYYPSTEGLFLSVPAYIAGLPEQWLNEEHEPATGKEVDFFINISLPGIVPVETVFSKLINIVNIIDTLEATGKRVNIIVQSTSTPCHDRKGQPKLDFQLKIKNAADPLNLQQLVYLIATPVLIRFAFNYFSSRYYAEDALSNYQDDSEELKQLKRTDIIYIPSFYYDWLRSIDNYSNPLKIYPHLAEQL